MADERKHGHGARVADPMMVKQGGSVSAASTFRRWGPLAAVIAALAAGYAFDLHEYLSLEALRRSQDTLLSFVARNAIGAAAAYFIVYAAAVAVSFPGASALTVAGGFMFGAVIGTALAWAAATAGATIIFLVARTSLGDLLAERAGARTQKLRAGFQEEGFNYLLFLRLVPLFPFWLVNLGAALFGMRLLPYVTATAIGILPGTFVLSYFGAGLGTALEAQGPKLPAELIVALVLLALLALVPVAARRWRGAAGRGESS
jgi:uncharacterized membrane protein YdjX (TVP38/TMEM64 family)